MTGRAQSWRRALPSSRFGGVRPDTLAEISLSDPETVRRDLDGSVH